MTDAIPPAPSLQTKAGLTISARGILEQYGIAVIGVALALAVRLALTSVLSGQESYLFYFPAVLVASAAGGWGPGVFATLLGLALGLLLVGRDRAIESADIINAAVFTLVGVGASWRGELLRRARLAAAASAEAALASAAHMKSILDTVPEAMIVIDERGVMQSFSAAAERLFGCRRR